MFDYLNGSKQKTLYKHAGEVTKLIYCERDKTVISASRDLTIVVSDEMHPDRGNLLKEIKVRRRACSHACGTCGGGGGAGHWSYARPVLRGGQGGHESEIGAMDFSPLLSLIASGCHDGLVCVWDYEFGKLATMCLGHTSGVWRPHRPPPAPSSPSSPSVLPTSWRLRLPLRSHHVYRLPGAVPAAGCSRRQRQRRTVGGASVAHRRPVCGSICQQAGGRAGCRTRGGVWHKRAIRRGWGMRGAGHAD